MQQANLGAILQKMKDLFIRTFSYNWMQLRVAILRKEITQSVVFISLQVRLLAFHAALLCIGIFGEILSVQYLGCSANFYTVQSCKQHQKYTYSEFQFTAQVWWG